MATPVLTRREMMVLAQRKIETRVPELQLTRETGAPIHCSYPGLHVEEPCLYRRGPRARTRRAHRHRVACRKPPRATFPKRPYAPSPDTVSPHPHPSGPVSDERNTLRLRKSDAGASLWRQSHQYPGSPPGRAAAAHPPGWRICRRAPSSHFDVSAIEQTVAR